MVGHATAHSGHGAAHTPPVAPRSQDDPDPGTPDEGPDSENPPQSDSEDPPQPDPEDPVAELARVRQALYEANQVIATLQRTASVTLDPASHCEPKVNKPTPFGGKLSEYHSFISQCMLTFTMCPFSYTRDVQKVFFVISYLVDSARNWARPILEREDHPLRNSFPAFKAALDDIYADRNLLAKARDKLGYLKQTKSVAAYAAEFQYIASPLELDDNSQRTMFYKGLDSEIKKALVYFPETDNFQNFVKQCVAVDQRMYYARKEEKFSTKAARPQSKTPGEAPSNPNHDSKKPTSPLAPAPTPAPTSPSNSSPIVPEVPFPMKKGNAAAMESCAFGAVRPIIRSRIVPSARKPRQASPSPPLPCILVRTCLRKTGCLKLL